MPKISVIIPIYGVEQYIEKCARSLFEQTLDDIEYIFVNDCTKDSSIKILEHVIEEYPSRKENVIILHHKVNQGLPSARKTGALVAKGDYIIYCDSDDWVDITAYERIYKKAISESADIVFFDYWRVSDNHCQAFHKSIPLYDKRLLLSKMLIGYTDASNVWSALVRRSLYVNIQFPKFNQMEDKVIMFQFIYYSTKMVSVPDCLYYYRYNPLSISRISGEEHNLRRWQNIKSNYELLFDFIKEKGIELQDALNCCKYIIKVSFPPSQTVVYPEVTCRGVLFNRWFWLYNYNKLTKKIRGLKERLLKK